VTEVEGGKTTKYTATRVYKTLKKNRIVMVHPKKKNVSGNSLTSWHTATLMDCMPTSIAIGTCLSRALSALVFDRKWRRRWHGTATLG
jgi:hypothetical protein